MITVSVPSGLKPELDTHNVQQLAFKQSQLFSLTYLHARLWVDAILDC